MRSSPRIVRQRDPIRQLRIGIVKSQATDGNVELEDIQMTSLGSRLSFATLLVGFIAIVQMASTLPARAQYAGQVNPYNGSCECVTFPCVCDDSAKKEARKGNIPKTAKAHKHQKQKVTNQSN